MGQESLEDADRSGRPIEVITPQQISIIEHLVLEDWRLKVKELAVITNISEASVRQIFPDHLGMNKISATSSRMCAVVFKHVWRRPKTDFGVHCHMG